jgi:quinoprotein glucose dehydrogenase
MRATLLLATLSLACSTCASLARDATVPTRVIDAGTGDKRLAGYEYPVGLKVEIITADSLVANLRSIWFLDDGTPVVIDRAARAKEKDAIKALSRSKSDGVWDRARVLLEAESISDVLPYDGRLYVAGNGAVRWFTPARDGEPGEAPSTIVSGFGGSPDGLRLTLGPDGWLYIAAAVGDHNARGVDGSRARAVGTGAVFRCRPDGSRLETFAVGLAGPAGVTFDVTGRAFAADGRLLHVAEGGDYRRLPPLLPAAKLTPADLVVNHGSPEGTVGLLHPDARRRVVQLYKLAPVGASFKVVEESTYLAAPKDALFAPSGMTVGPEGAIYLVDRRDGKQGRILRLSHSTARSREMNSWAKVSTLKDDELIRALSSEHAGDRERARRELAKRGDKNRAALTRLLDNDDTSLAGRLGAMGALQSMVNDDVFAALLRTLADGEFEAQRVAAEMLGLFAKKNDRAVTDALTKALATEDRAVRRAVALALGRLANPGAADSLAAALSFDDGTDVVMRDGIARAVEMLGKPGVEALLSLADSGVQKDSDRVLEVFLTFRTRPAFDAIVKLLKNPHLSVNQRADLVRSSGNYQLDPPVSLDNVLGHVLAEEKGSPAVLKAMLDAVASPGVARSAKGEAFVKEAKRADEVREKKP